MVDLDSNPTKLIEIVEVGKQLLITRGALTTFSIANDVAKYFAILPAIFVATYAARGQPTGRSTKLNVMDLGTPQSAIISAIVFNAIVIPLLVPIALRGVHYRPVGATALLRRNLLDLRPRRPDRPVHRDQADRPDRPQRAGGVTMASRPGADPRRRSAPLVSDRAHACGRRARPGWSRRTRARGSPGSLEDAIARADRPHSPSAPRVPVRREAAREARAALLELAERLRGPRPVDPRGVRSRRNCSSTAPDPLYVAGRSRRPARCRPPGARGSGRPGAGELSSAVEPRRSATQAGRGHYKVFLGMAAGVGKTVAHAPRGQAADAEAGRDVVIGLLETHGRAETLSELAEGSRSSRGGPITYRGVPLEEMDLAAILARKPGPVPRRRARPHQRPRAGAREALRRTSRTLLDAGIDVLGTLNVQHLETLNDQVAELSGVHVRETVPDRCSTAPTRSCSSICTPEALLERLRAGKIYPPERIEAALNGFFRIENLAALREIALRQVAEEVEAKRLVRGRGHARGALRRPQAVGERLLALVEPDPGAQRLVRRAWRSAQRLGARARRALGAAARARAGPRAGAPALRRCASSRPCSAPT